MPFQYKWHTNEFNFYYNQQYQRGLCRRDYVCVCEWNNRIHVHVWGVELWFVLINQEPIVVQLEATPHVHSNWHNCRIRDSVQNCVANCGWFCSDFQLFLCSSMKIIPFFMPTSPQCATMTSYVPLQLASVNNTICAFGCALAMYASLPLTDSFSIVQLCTTCHPRSATVTNYSLWNWGVLFHSPARNCHMSLTLSHRRKSTNLNFLALSPQPHIRTHAYESHY